MTIRHLMGLGSLGSFVNRITNEPGSINEPVGGLIGVDSNRSVLSDIVELPIVKEQQTEQTVADSKILPHVPSRVVESKQSSVAAFSTLRNSFSFEAVPIYNFFVEDEEFNDSEPRGDRELKNIPRYIHLKWRPSPTTDKPPITKRLPLPTKTKRNSYFGLGATILPATRQGIKFNPDKAATFSVAIGSVANGYVAPGTISAVVETPLVNAGIPVRSMTPSINEQDFLEDDETNGVPIQDLQTNINRRMNGTLGVADVSKRVISKETESSRGQLFDGMFAISRNVGGMMNMRSTAASSPAISLNFRTADVRSVNMQAYRRGADPVFSLMDRTADVRKPADERDFTEVNFIDPAIVGIVSEEKVDLITTPEHAENTIGLAQFLPNLTVLADVKDDIKGGVAAPDFPAFQEDSGTEYVGYVIEKYEQGKDGVFNLIDEIEIPEAAATQFVDTKVKYGAIYRYRMKSILRWTRKSNILHGGYAKGNFTDEDFTSTKHLATHKASYYQSEWNRRWQYASVIDTIDPSWPDEFRLRPESHRKRVVVSWKLPDNGQKDIHYYRLFRKEQDEDGNDLTDWGDPLDIRMGATNVLYFDNDVEYGVRYVYAAQTVSRHNELSLLSDQLSVMLNEEFKESGEHPITQVSQPGVRLDAVGVFETKPPRIVRPLVIARDNLALVSRVGTDAKPLIDRDYHIRFESLDTGETRDVIINMEYDNSVPPDETINEDHVIRPKPVLPDRGVRDAIDGPSMGTGGAKSDTVADRGRTPTMFISSLSGINPNSLK